MTPIDAFVLVAAMLDCLAGLYTTIDDLQQSVALIDIDGLALSLCALDAQTHSALRELERVMVS